MVICYIGVGSNVGNRQSHITAAINQIKQLVLTRVLKISRIIETLPEGGPPQGKYLNGVIEIETGLLPYQLLAELQRIERMLGRVRTVRCAPRTIDLDILLYGDARIKEESLCIPHPSIGKRDFVLVPLAEIAPERAAEFDKRVAKRKKRQR